MLRETGQRYGLGLQRLEGDRSGCRKIWVHAASVGEVQAAAILINELKNRGNKYCFFLSTTTIQGMAVARKILSDDVFCFLAPLDVPFNVRRFISTVEPDMYICLETELWPAVFNELHRRGTASIVVNGRMTRRSFQRYQLIRGLMKRILSGVKGIAVISGQDGERFISLGAPPDLVRVTGNVKFDYPAEDVDSIRENYRRILGAGDATVFICGSTRTGEEKILAKVYGTLREKSGREILWVIAPRHLERLGEVRHLLDDSGLAYELYSNLSSTRRRHSVVLVDTMGDLAKLYSAGDLNFVGGSLVDRRGHNIMEAARWGRPVYYGPSIGDFKEAAEILENGGGSFRVENDEALASLLLEHLQDKEAYLQASRNAAEAIAQQRGALGRQADMVTGLLAEA